MFRLVSPVIVFRKSLAGLMHWRQIEAMLWLRQSSSLCMLIVSLLVVSGSLQGCAEKKSTLLSQKDLQLMVNQSFFSPQIRKLNLMPGVGVQLYVETPEVWIIEGQSTVLFKFNAQVDADFFGHTFTERLPLSVEGSADLDYREGEHAFYFQNVDLHEARVDMQVALFETLILDKLKQALTQDISQMAVINLNDTSPLLQEINGRGVSSSIVNGELLLSYTPKP
ncbi:hypothetical protein N9V90_02135 [Endozoicomonas sp.]|nr:hypothetical protein [Endozoicomonas sp.]